MKQTEAKPFQWGHEPRVRRGFTDLPPPLRDAVAQGLGTAASSVRVVAQGEVCRAMVTMLADADPREVPMMMMVDDGRSEFGRARTPALTLTTFGTDPRRLAQAFRVLADALDATALATAKKFNG